LNDSAFSGAVAVLFEASVLLIMARNSAKISSVSSSFVFLGAGNFELFTLGSLRVKYRIRAETSARFAMFDPLLPAVVLATDEFMAFL